MRLLSVIVCLSIIVITKTISGLLKGFWFWFWFWFWFTKRVLVSGLLKGFWF